MFDIHHDVSRDDGISRSHEDGFLVRTLRRFMNKLAISQRGEGRSTNQLRTPGRLPWLDNYVACHHHAVWGRRAACRETVR